MYVLNTSTDDHIRNLSDFISSQRQWHQKHDLLAQHSLLMRTQHFVYRWISSYSRHDSVRQQRVNHLRLLQGALLPPFPFHLFAINIHLMSASLKECLPGRSAVLQRIALPHLLGFFRIWVHKTYFSAKQTILSKIELFFVRTACSFYWQRLTRWPSVTYSLLVTFKCGLRMCLLIHNFYDNVWLSFHRWLIFPLIWDKYCLVGAFLNWLFS